ncbi:MAG: tyrosine-type recombinase/integrase [Luteibaculum sp.]
MLESFLEYLLHNRKYSEHTIISYRNDLEQFHAFLQDQFELTQVGDCTRDQIRTWVMHLMDSGKSPGTVNRKLATLSSYFKFLQSAGVVKSNPVKLVPKPKKAKKLPTYIDSHQSEKLFSEVEFPEDFWGVQERLILEVLFGTGIRLSELINLKLNNVNLSSGWIKVLGKRNKERIIPLTRNLVSLLHDFLEKRKRNEGHELPFLFMTKGVKKLYPKFVYRVVNSYLQQVTTGDKKSPHVLRHSFATQLLNKGADLNAIKEILGHESLSATQVYTHNSIEKNKEILRRSHPRG